MGGNAAGQDSRARQAATGGTPVRIALIGSSGSIGRQTVEVLRLHPESFTTVALATGSQAAVLEEQARTLRPKIVALTGMGHGAALSLPEGTLRIEGPDALEELATRPDVDLVVVATGGLVALRSVLAALAAGKVVATANKETLVAGGHLVMPVARRLAASAVAWPGSPTPAAATYQPGCVPRWPTAEPLYWLRPIDSEHSAIWQCLAGEEHRAIARLILTASGGPFLGRGEADLATVTASDALRHPTWTMGSKITVDSATLANKGLEVIEAHWLYDVPLTSIDVVIHPQSVVHSAVQFVDGSLKAQLGLPDMRLPIQYALTYPVRLPSPVAAVDLVSAGRLDFAAPDEGRFPALRIAREAGVAGPRSSAALISADEVAVARFLGGSLDFLGIARLLGAAVERFGSSGSSTPSLEELFVLDAEVRAFAGSWR